MAEAFAGVDRIGFADIGEIFLGRVARPVARQRAEPFADFVGAGIDRLALGDRRDFA